ncbi:MAG: hypothetical protein ACQKBT_08095 [Puniceicoccales bacterium]
MDNQKPQIVSRLEALFSGFEGYGRKAFSWKVYPVVNASSSSGEKPEVLGAGISVEGEKLRVFDTGEGRWRPFEGRQLIFTIDEENELCRCMGGNAEDGGEVPLFRVNDLSEIPAYVALHVEGVLDDAAEINWGDPVGDVLLPFAQYPDDECEYFDDYPHVSTVHLFDVIAEHCTARVPWLFSFPDRICEIVKTTIQETDPEGEIESRAEDGGRLRSLEHISEFLNRSAREHSWELPEIVFERDLDPSHCLRLHVSPFAPGEREFEIEYPFLVKFFQPVFPAFCSPEISPRFTEYLFHRILLATNLPADLWPLSVSKEDLRESLPTKVFNLPYGEQVNRTFQILALRRSLEEEFQKILDGAVGPCGRSSGERIELLQDLLSKVRSSSRGREGSSRGVGQ